LVTCEKDGIYATYNMEAILFVLFLVIFAKDVKEWKKKKYMSDEEAEYLIDY
jgi:hypothetical protein